MSSPGSFGAGPGAQTPYGGLRVIELSSDPAVFPPPDVLAKCEMIKDLGEATPKLDAMWTELKAF